MRGGEREKFRSLTEETIEQKRTVYYICIELYPMVLYRNADVQRLIYRFRNRHRQSNTTTVVPIRLMLQLMNDDFTL